MAVKNQLVVVCDNLRSCANVGSIIRSASFFNCHQFVFIGISPYPALANDRRLPHQRRRQESRIAKTALTSLNRLQAGYYPNPDRFLADRAVGANQLHCLEQTDQARSLSDWPGLTGQQPVYLVVGNEIDGVSAEFLNLTDNHWQIPAAGGHNSLNVATAAGIALFAISNFHKQPPA